MRDVPRDGDADFREELSRRARTSSPTGSGTSSRARSSSSNATRRAESTRRRPPGRRSGGAAPRYRPRSAGPWRPYDLRGAAGAVRDVVDEANAFASAERPVGAGARGDARLDAVLATLLGACHTVARELAPFLPDGAARIEAALATTDAAAARSLFPKFAATARAR